MCQFADKNSTRQRLVQYLGNAGNHQASSNAHRAEDELVVDNLPEADIINHQRMSCLASIQSQIATFILVRS